MTAKVMCIIGERYAVTYLQFFFNINQGTIVNRFMYKESNAICIIFHYQIMIVD